jgi:hypothetical protein
MSELMDNPDKNSPPTPAQHLLYAVFQNDVARARGLLEEGVSPNGAGSLDLLSRAIVCRQLPMRDLLLEFGATPNHPGALTWNTLALRLEKGALKFLLHRFSLEEHPSPQGFTPLRFLVEKINTRHLKSEKFWDVATLLISHGASPGLPGEEGRHAFDILLSRIRRESDVRIARVNLGRYRTLLELALNKGFDPDALAMTNAGALIHHSALTLPLIRLLMDHGANPALPVCTRPLSDQPPVELGLLRQAPCPTSPEWPAFAQLCRDVWARGEGLERQWARSRRGLNPADLAVVEARSVREWIREDWARLPEKQSMYDAFDDLWSMHCLEQLNGELPDTGLKTSRPRL